MTDNVGPSDNLPIYLAAAPGYWVIALTISVVGKATIDDVRVQRLPVVAWYIYEKQKKIFADPVTPTGIATHETQGYLELREGKVLISQYEFDIKWIKDVCLEDHNRKHEEAEERFAINKAARDEIDKILGLYDYDDPVDF